MADINARNENSMNIYVLHTFTIYRNTCIMQQNVSVTVYFHFYGTEDPLYNDNVCYQRFCCKIKFAVIKKLDMDPP